MSLETVMQFLGGPNTKEWRTFERLVAALHGAAGANVQTKWNDTINGRQFDVTLRFKKGLHDYLTVIECKHVGSKVPVEKVDAFVTKARDVLANKAVMVSTTGFQSGAVDAAKRHGIKLLTIDEVFEDPHPVEIKGRTPGVCIYDARFIRGDDGKDIPLEETTGRFEYLWKKSLLLYRGRERTLEDWVNALEPSIRTTIPDREDTVTLNFHPGALWKQPYEEEVPVRTLVFHRKPVDFVIPSDPRSPIVDRYVLERMGLTIRVMDEYGEILESKKLQEIAFDFDTHLQPGRCYWKPALGNYYHLDRVDGDLLTWTIAESYQHGHLIQVTYTQKREHSKGFVEVDDEKVLRRLRRMLRARAERKAE